jgi:hypothetical protein
MFNYPILFFPLSLFVLWLSSYVGTMLRRRKPLVGEDREDFGFVQAAALTLLGLIIGFSFSMAIGRYDQRRNYEEAEANAIGTEFVRAGLLAPSDAARVRAQLASYLSLRIEFYRTSDRSEIQKISGDTNELQTEMWSAVQTPALAQPTPLMALTVAGMNDVLNSQGYTQAAWWNRIPVAAWILMIAISICCNLLVGYGARGARTKSPILLILPFFVSIAFLLIAEIDAPRGVLIQVPPQNLVSLAQSLTKH